MRAFPISCTRPPPPSATSAISFASRSVRYLGHSPGGGAMIVLLLLLLAGTVLTGMIVYGGEHQGGPFQASSAKKPLKVLRTCTMSSRM